MTQPPTFWSSFRHVDGSEDPQALASYLDVFNASAPVAEGKRRSIELLDVAPGDHALDVGCGAGDDTRTLKEAVGALGRAVGADSSEHLVAEARLRAAAAGVDIEFVVADACALPFADDTFAGCRCDRTLQHLDAPVRALREMSRVVSPGGRLVVTEMGNSIDGDVAADRDLLARARERFAPIGAKDGWFGTFVPLLLTRAGLRGVGIEEQRGVLADFASASHCFNLEAIADQMVQDGECRADEAERWLGELRAGIETGRLRAIVRIFHFFGTVAPTPSAGPGQPSSSES